MYIAELKGKIPREFEFKEDILTSNVFSFFKYSTREIFLKALIDFLEITIGTTDLGNAEFIFWPKFEDGTEPDLLILIGGHYLLFEAKYTSGFGQETEFIQHQLEREYLQGCLQAKTLGLKFSFFAITNDLFENKEKYSDVPKFLWGKVKFINWQNVTSLIEKILSSKLALSVGDRMMAEDLYSLLLLKGLRIYEGFRHCKSLGSVSQPKNTIFYEVSNSISINRFKGYERSLVEFIEIKPPTSVLFWRIKSE